MLRLVKRKVSCSTFLKILVKLYVTLLEVLRFFGDICGGGVMVLSAAGELPIVLVCN